MGLPFTRGGVTTPPVAMVTLWSQGTGPGSLSPGPQTQEAADREDQSCPALERGTGPGRSSPGKQLTFLAAVRHHGQGSAPQLTSQGTLLSTKKVVLHIERKISCKMIIQLCVHVFILFFSYLCTSHPK